MQSLSVPVARNPNEHTPGEVLSALRAPLHSRRLSFRYELFNASGAYVRDLDNVVACTVKQNWLADIKRTADFTLRDSGTINYLSDRIRPYVRLHLPPYGPRDWVEWAQGTFGLISPKRGTDQAGVITRAVQGYDLLQVVADMRVENRYVLAAGGTYMSGVKALLDATALPVAATTPASSATTPAAREWAPGTSHLRIINDLLDALNYESLSFDEFGVPRVTPYQSPGERPEEHVYADDRDGLMVPDHEQTLDIFSVPNKWTLVVSNPDRPLLVGTYTNNDPASPTSTIRRGRTIAAEPEFVDAPDQSTLNALAARRGFDASQIFEVVEFSTGLMPIHSGNDVYRIAYSPLAINAKYVEQSWSMPLQIGAHMRHEARRVVNV